MTVLRCAMFSVGSTELSGSETARVHHAARRCGCVADRGARAAASDAGDPATRYPVSTTAHMHFFGRPTIWRLNVVGHSTLNPRRRRAPRPLGAMGGFS